MANMFREDGFAIYKDIVASITSSLVVDLIDMPKYKEKEDFEHFLNFFKIDKEDKMIFPSNLVEKLAIDMYSDLYAGCKIIFYPLKDKTLFQIFTNSQRYNDLFGYYIYDEDLKKDVYCNGKYDFVSDYIYYNNTDMPDDLTEEEWKKREKDWDEVFSKSSIPSECGLIIELGGFILPDKDLYRFPSFEERVEKAAEEKANAFFKKKILKENPNISVGNFRKLLAKEDVNKKTLEYVDELKEILVKEIDFKDVLMIKLK